MIYSASYDSSEVIPDEIEYYKDEFMQLENWKQVEENISAWLADTIGEVVVDTDTNILETAGYSKEELDAISENEIDITNTDISKVKKLMQNSNFVDDLEDKLYSELGSDSFLFDDAFESFKESLPEVLDTMNTVLGEHNIPLGDLYLQTEYANGSKIEWKFDSSKGSEDEFVDTFIESYSYNEEISIKFDDETLETTINGRDVQFLISSFDVMDSILYDLENNRTDGAEIQILLKHLNKEGVMPKNKKFLSIILNIIYDEDVSEDVDYRLDSSYMAEYFAFEGFDRKYIAENWLNIDKAKELEGLYHTMSLASSEPAFLKFMERSKEKTAVSIYLDAYTDYMMTLIDAIYDAIDDAMHVVTSTEEYKDQLKAVS